MPMALLGDDGKSEKTCLLRKTNIKHGQQSGLQDDCFSNLRHDMESFHKDEVARKKQLYTLPQLPYIYIYIYL